MSEKIVINLEKPVQVFEIMGKDYNVYYDDDAIYRYHKVLIKFKDEVDEINKRQHDEAESDIDSFEILSNEEREKIRQKQMGLIKELITEVFGEGSFEAIYKSSGESIIIMSDVIDAFGKWVFTKLNNNREDRMNYYLNNKKKNNKHNSKNRNRHNKQRNK